MQPFRVQTKTCKPKLCEFISKPILGDFLGSTLSSSSGNTPVTAMAAQYEANSNYRAEMKERYNVRRLRLSRRLID